MLIDRYILARLRDLLDWLKHYGVEPVFVARMNVAWILLASLFPGYKLFFSPEAQFNYVYAIPLALFLFLVFAFLQMTTMNWFITLSKKNSQGSLGLSAVRLFLLSAGIALVVFGLVLPVDGVPLIGAGAISIMLSLYRYLFEILKAG